MYNIFHEFFYYLINRGMYFYYAGTKVHYNFSKKKKGEALVLLHGWGGSISSFDAIKKLKDHYMVLIVDFPPFGKSEEGQEWNVFSYANMLISLCEHLKIEKCHILGHSFGGRVGILVSVIQKSLVKKIILVDSAGMKPRRKPFYYFKNLEYKIRKFFRFDTSQFGSSDYKALSPNMKKVFSRIVSTHLEEYASMITQETLLVFGEKDKETPLYMGKRLNKLIKNSKLIVFKGCSHFCYLERPYEFCKLVIEFLEGEK